MDRGELGSQIHKWALEEMYFRPKGRHINTKLPTPDDLQQLCRGQAGDALYYVINHVYSTQTVRKVKGNLHLHSQQLARGTKYAQGEPKQADDKSRLIEQHSELSYQLTSNLTAIGHVEKDLIRIKKEIVNTEESFREATRQVQDLRRKSALLKAYSQNVESSLKTYSEYTNRIKSKVTDLTDRASKTDTGKVFTKKDSCSDNEDQGLETLCTKDVRESSQVIAAFLHQMLSGKFADNIDLLNKRKELLWKKVESITSDHPPAHQLSSLLSNTHEAATALRGKTQHLNIFSDAEKLSFKIGFKYEGGSQLTDLSSPPTVLQTVQDLLQNAHQSNIQRFIQMEKSKNSAWKLKEKLVKAKEPVLQHFERSYRGDPAAHELAKVLFDLECQIAASRANLKELENTSEKMKDKISQSMREKEVLLSKYQKIQNFRKLADNKQNLIRVLVKQNLNAKNRLENQQQKIREYIERAMSVHEPETRAHCATLHNSVTQEVEDFSQMHLPYLMFTVLEGAWKVSVIDLSINRLQGGQVNSNVVSTLKTIMDLTDCPAFKASEQLLASVVDLKQRVIELDNKLHFSAYERDLEHNTTVENISKLSEEVESHDTHQIEKLLPSLQRRLALATQALTKCLHVKDTAQFWWEQPAQFTTPWIEVDEQSYQAWHDKWTVLVTRLRQLHVQKKEKL